MNRRIITLLLIFCSAPAAAQPAAPSHPSPYQAMEWRNIGPFRGGRAPAVAGIPSQPRTYYFGGSGGGVFKTENAGETWTNVTDGFVKTSSVGSIAVAPSDPNVVYVGMGENTARGVALSNGDGVYKSTDSGRTWKHVGLDKTRAIARVRIHPANPDLVYVAAQGATYGPSKDRGIYRSKDGGATWQQVLYVDETSGPSDLAMDPANPRILYAAIWDHLRKPWEIRSGGPGSSLYKSTDGGDSWQKINTGLPKLLGKMGISVSANSDRLYAIVEADPEGGLYRSDNAGKTWTLQNATWAIKTRSWYYMKVFADPKNPDVVWVLNANALKSIDGGKTFVNVPAPHGDHHDLWINPNNPDILINGNDGGANISFDQGRSWSTQENQPTAQFYRVNTDNRYPYWVYGGQQDNTSVGIASRANGPGIGWKDWYSVGGCESAYVDFNPDNPALIYAGCYQGMITEFDDSTRTARDVGAYPELDLALPSREMKYRYNWNAPILVSKSDPKVIYHAAQKLLKSSNGGRTWVEISPDLTNPDDKTQGNGGGPITNEGAGGEVYDTIFYVAEAPHNPNVLWTGSDDGRLFLTRDGGVRWNRILLPGVPDAQLNAIEVSPHDPATVYVAATRYKYNDFTPYIFKTTDSGQTWQPIVDGIPAESWAHVVREDPARKDLLYAATETGVFVSFNGGKHWQPLQLNLPVTPVTDLKVHANDLVAATSGRAFWILDDLAPLRQAAEDAAASSTYLVKPPAAIRSNTGPGGSAGLPAGASLGKNPPAGAILDFSVPKEVPASIEIRTAAGALIRRYSTEKEPGATAPTLKLKAGGNRLVWDLRYSAPPAIPGVFLFGALQGRRVIPGAYQVTLTAAGQTRTTSLDVRKDPRLNVTPQQYAEQEKLLSAVDQEFYDLQQSVLRLRKVRARIEDVLQRTPDKTGIQTMGKALVEKLNASEEVLIQKRTVDMQTVINFPVRLAHHYLYLHSSIDEGDTGVTDGARKRFADLSKKWTEQKAELNTIFGPGLDAFNRRVAEDKVPAVSAADTP